VIKVSFSAVSCLAGEFQFMVFFHFYSRFVIDCDGFIIKLYSTLWRPSGASSITTLAQFYYNTLLKWSRP